MADPKPANGSVTVQPAELPRPAGSAARASSSEKVALNATIPKDLHDRLVAAAEDHDVNTSWLVAKALSFFLPRLRPAAEMDWMKPDPAT